MDKQTTLILIFLPVLIIPLWIGLFMWLMARLRRPAEQPLSSDMNGVTVIPVRQLKRFYGFFGSATNSIGPRLEVAPEGLRFRLFKPDYWAFADIVRIDFFPLPILTRLEVRSRPNGLLYVDLADRAAARRFLRALPAELPFTDRARTLREGRE